jgi:hypothetical protein
MEESSLSNAQAAAGTIFQKVKQAKKPIFSEN